jgi:hypothetical protein
MTKKTQLPAKLGRPSKYTPELADRLCEEIAKGHSVHQLAGQGEFPSELTIYAWLDHHEDFLKKYRIARELQADLLADEVLLIVDGKLPVLTDEPNKDTAVRVSRDIARAKHRVWQAGRMSPRKWDDRVAHGHGDSDGNPLPRAVIVVRSTADRKPAPKAIGGKGDNGD